MNNIFFWRNTMSSWYINFIDIEKMFDSIHCRVKKKRSTSGWFLVNTCVPQVFLLAYGGGP